MNAPRTMRLTRPLELRDFVDDAVLRLIAQPLGGDIALLLEEEGAAGGIGAVGIARRVFLPDGGVSCENTFIETAGMAFEHSLAIAVAELVAMETGGGVSMCCQAFSPRLAGGEDIREASLTLARNLVSKIQMRQQ